MSNGIDQLLVIENRIAGTRYQPPTRNVHLLGELTQKMNFFARMCGGGRDTKEARIEQMRCLIHMIIICQRGVNSIYSDIGLGEYVEHHNLEDYAQ